MEVSKQFKWALVTPHLYILFCQKVSSSEDTGLYCNSGHIKSDGRNGTRIGPTVVEVDTSTYLRLFWLLISTWINCFRADQLKTLKHEQNADGLLWLFPPCDPPLSVSLYPSYKSDIAAVGRALHPLTRMYSPGPSLNDIWEVCAMQAGYTANLYEFDSKIWQ